FLQDPDGNYVGSNFMTISVQDFSVAAFGQDIDLLTYAGRVNATFDGVDLLAGNGRLYVRQHPTQAVTANTSTGSQGAVVVRNSEGVYFEKESFSDYGTYNANYSGAVRIESSVPSTNASMLVDADG